MSFPKCLDKHNQTVCNLGDGLFHPAGYSEDSCTQCLISELVPFYCWVGFHGRATPSVPHHSPVEGQLRCFQLGAIRDKAAINIHLQVFVRMNVGLHVSGKNAQECWIIWYWHIRFLRNCQIIFHSVCTIYIPTSTVIVISSPCSPCVCISFPHHYLFFLSLSFFFGFGDFVLFWFCSIVLARTSTSMCIL